MRGLMLMALVAGCAGGTGPSVDGGTGGGTGGGASEDAGGGGDAGTGFATVRFSVRATEHCPVDPPQTPGLSRVTPVAARVGLVGLELLRSRSDPSPFRVTLNQPLVEVDLVAGGVVAEGPVPAGTWRFLRYSQAFGAVTVPATAHQGGMVLPGQLEFDIATAPYATAAGSRAAGQLTARFNFSGSSFSTQATVPLDCPLSESGGLVETGSAHLVTVPVPGGALTVVDGAALQEVEAQFPLAGAFTWKDLAAPGFAAGVLDITPTPTGSETPARLPICDLLLSDRCEATARPVRSVPAWPMPDSATTTCTDGTTAVSSCPGPGAPFFGQDGNSSVNAAHFTVQGEVVKDEVTGLTWQRVASADSYDWWAAHDYCDALVLGGRDDWSLPSRLELVSLLDVGRFGPSIDLATFPGEPSDFFWSASPALFSSLAFGVRFDQGFVYDHDPRVSGRVRCVADAHPGPAGRLTVNGVTVSDGATGLVWQRGVNGAQTWRDALATCQGLSLGGLTGWRLPTMKELLTIVEDTALNPSGDVGAFPDTPAEWLWASSPGLAPPDYGWAVSFTDGFCTPAAVSQLYVSRCVR